MSRMTGPPDIVPDVDEPTLREIYGTDADEVIAFRRFLQVMGRAPDPDAPPEPRVIPDHWFKYAHGEISGAEALKLDDEAKTG